MKLLTALIAAQFLLVVISSYASAQLTLVESVKLLEAQMLAARQQIDQLKKDNQQLSSEVDGLEGDVGFLTAQIEAATKEINRLEALVVVLELQVINLRNSLADTNAELLELKDVVAQFVDLTKPEYDIPDAHSQQVTAVSFSRDNQFLITASTESRINVWKDGKFYKVLDGIDGPIASFALNLDSHIVTGSEFGKSVLVYNETFDLIERLNDVVEGVYKVVIDPDDKEQAYIGSNRRVFIVQLLGESGVLATDGHLTAPVHAMAINLNKQLLFTGCLYDSKIYVWNATDANYLDVLTGDTTPVETLIYDPRSERVVSGHQDGVIGLWDVNKLGNVRLLRGHTDRTLALALRVNEDFLFSASQDRTIKIWDLKTDATTPFRSIPFSGSGIPTSLDINQAKDQLVIGSSAGGVQVIPIEKLLY